MVPIPLRHPTGGPIRRVLLTAVRVGSTDAALSEALADLGPAGLPALVEVARSHRVGPLLHARLEAMGDRAPAFAVEALAVDRGGARARHLSTMRALAPLSAALGEPPVVFKGPALAARWYADPACRVYNDLDVLVPTEHFGATLDRLLAAGFLELSGNWDGLLTHQVSEIPLEGAGIWLDLHWDLIALGATRREIRLDLLGMDARSSEITLGGTGVRVWEPADTLLHLCVSTGLDGARRLLQLVDVDRVARDAGLDWSAFFSRARSSGAHALCLAVLTRASRMLGTPLPEGTSSRLEPFPGWAGLSDLAETWPRSDRRLSDGVGSGLLVSSGRASLPTTVRTLARMVLGELRARSGGTRLTDAGGDLDWQRSSGQVATSRRAYLAWVESQR